MKFVLSIIVAASQNRVIGRENSLIWHLPEDLKHFKELTISHTVIMGRRTYESIGRALPQRRNIVISRNPLYRAEGCEVVSSIEEALKAAGQEGEVFVIGGGTIFRQVWERADRLYITYVHTVVQGDTFLPEIDLSQWEMVERNDFNADEKNEFDYSFVVYNRKK